MKGRKGEERRGELECEKRKAHSLGKSKLKRGLNRQVTFEFRGENHIEESKNRYT